MSQTFFWGCMRKRLGDRIAICCVVAILIAGLERGSEAQEWTYTVRPGDNLWNISERYLASMAFWEPLRELNDVSAPRNIPPGSTLRVPVRWLKKQPAAVRVTFVVGQAWETDGLTGGTVPLEAGATLDAADVIETQAESSVTLEFADGSRFIVQEETRLEFDRVTMYGSTGMVDTRLRLHEGRLDARTSSGQAAGSRFEVWTPAGVSAVRGTRYRMAMAPAGDIGLSEVVQGAIEVFSAGNIEQVAQGFGTVTERGRPPSPPIRLLDPPDLSGLPDLFERVPVQFELPELAGAAAYRLQIAAEPEFQALLFDRTYPRPQFTGIDLPDGAYALRVRGIDERQLEGLDATHRFELDARPEPPVLMTPGEGGTVREPVPEFRWTEPEEARRFHFQLAPEGDFSAPVIDLEAFAETALTPEIELPPGPYSWRVATIDGSGERGPFSDAQNFTLRPAPPSPEVEDPEIDEETMVFQWRAGLSGQKYQVQLARDRRFEDIVVDETLDEPRLELPRPVPGPYYLRVRTIDVDGYRPPFGSPQKFDVPPTSYWSLLIVPLIALAILL